MKLLIVVAIVSTMNIQLAAADCAANTTNVSGYIVDRNGTGIPGAIVANVTGTIASNKSEYSTTTATGYFNMTCVNESSAVESHWDAYDYFTVNASGYTQQTINYTLLSKTTWNNTYENSSIVMTPITPVTSGITVSGITRTSATVSWTVAAISDNVNRNPAGNQMIWGSSGIVNETSAWSNYSLAPSYSLTNLKEGQTYTVYYKTYNEAAAGYRAMSTTTFTTKKSNMGAILAGETGAPTPAKPQGVVQILTSANKTPQQRNIIIVAAVVIIGIIAYVGYTSKAGGKGGRKK